MSRNLKKSIILTCSLFLVCSLIFHYYSYFYRYSIPDLSEYISLCLQHSSKKYCIVFIVQIN